MATDYTIWYRKHKINIRRESVLAEYVATWSNGKVAGTSPGWDSAHKAETWAKLTIDAKIERKLKCQTE